MTSENLCEPSPILAPLGEILCEQRRLWHHGSHAPVTHILPPRSLTDHWGTSAVVLGCQTSTKVVRVTEPQVIGNQQFNAEC